MKRLVLSLILATICGISAFAQELLLANASLSKGNISLNKQISNTQRSGETAVCRAILKAKLCGLSATTLQ